MSNFAANSIPMKYLAILSALVGLVACSSDKAEEFNNDPYLVSDEVFKMKMGNDEVYGVRLKMTAPEKRQYVSYSVRLAQGEKVWIDTIYTEVYAGDTTENELIFSEAVVRPEDRVEVQAENIHVE